jgi:mannose/cellobiose epimerase-like protein (N-acyl-D-glucosamine 2-epimerase family)
MRTPMTETPDYLALFTEAATNAINPELQAVFDALRGDGEYAKSLRSRWMPHTPLDDALVALARHLTSPPKDA